jgi:predicted site-specific integrase-resolvase
MVDYINIKNACAKLGITDVTFKRLVDSGKINYIKSDKTGIRLYDVERFIEKRDLERKLAEITRPPLQKIG